MNMLSELTSLFDALDIPVETGVFSETAPEQYVVFTPLADTFELFADNLPYVDIQEIRISLFSKGNYLKTKNAIVRSLLSAEITITDRRYIGHEDNTGYHHFAIDVAKEYETEEYVDFVMEQVELARNSCNDPIVLIEKRLDFSCYVPEGFGTGDCLIISDERLHIIDFKYGMGVLVDAVDNPQMKLYALGALEIYDSLYDIEEVSMTIFQPRRENVSTWTVPVEELKCWAEEELKPKAVKAYNGEGEYIPGDWCTFCKAAVRCRARAEEKLKLAQTEFKMPPLLTDNEIEEILFILPDLTKWANEITSYATDAAVNHGKEWNGFKVVEGRSVRKYKDEDAIAEKAVSSGFKDIYRKSLIPMTEMQKLMGKTKFEEILGDLIYKPPGKPTLVPNSDKRPAMNVADAKNEFNEIMED